MKKVFDYRRHVEECKMLPRQSGSEQHRQMLLNMAETWEHWPKLASKDWRRVALPRVIDLVDCGRSIAGARFDRPWLPPRQHEPPGGEGLCGPQTYGPLEGSVGASDTILAARQT